MKAVKNGRLLLPDGKGSLQVQDGLVMLYDTKIEAFCPETELVPDSVEVLDAAGAYVAPGFINVHVHGCLGYDTMDDAAEALPAIRRGQARSGVTAFLPTTMTYDFPRIYRALERVRSAMKVSAPDGADVLGCHMEGPFLNRSFKGAQDPQYMIEAEYSRLQGYTDVIKLVTVAPELPGSEAFIRACRDDNIVVSLGHSAADYALARQAIEDWGVTHVTHLFNAMSSFQHRAPGLVGAALDTDVHCELIADNIHVHPAAQRLAYKLKGTEQLILVTDSMRACLLGNGVSELGGQKVLVEGQRAVLADGTIAGSVLTLDRALAIFMQNTGISIEAAVAMVTQTPARELGIFAQRGSLDIGKKADFVLLGSDVSIVRTVVGGRVVYTAE